MKSFSFKIQSLFICLICLIFISQFAYAIPPSRAIRLKQFNGEVSFLPNGIEEWVQPVRNRTLTIGDRLWSDQNSRAELQLNTASICMGQNTSLIILNFEDNKTQLQMTEGRLNLYINSIKENESFEIDTPYLAMMIRQAGNYRIEIDTDSNTTVTLFQGRADVYGERASFKLSANKSYKFIGEDLGREILKNPEADEMDQQCFKGQRSNLVTAQYVSTEVVGYEDLEEYGEWESINTYGYVWRPLNVDHEWRPYFNGYWTWVDPWGWTWLDYEPWGFATTHYGRWVFVTERWYWIPGPIHASPVYAPALVSFFQFNNNSIGWIALGPHEFYWPSYSVDQNYFININLGNTIINQTQLVNVYNNSIIQQNFINAAAPNSITTISTSAFVNSNAVQKAGKSVKLSSTEIQKGVLKTVPIVPTQKSVVGEAAAVDIKPSEKTLKTPTVATESPKNLNIPFSEKQAIIEKNKGEPLTNEQLNELEGKVQQNISQKTKKGIMSIDEEEKKKTEPNIKTIVPAAPTEPAPMAVPTSSDKPAPMGEPTPMDEPASTAAPSSPAEPASISVPADVASPPTTPAKPSGPYLGVPPEAPDTRPTKPSRTKPSKVKPSERGSVAPSEPVIPSAPEAPNTPATFSEPLPATLPNAQPTPAPVVAPLPAPATPPEPAPVVVPEPQPTPAAPAEPQPAPVVVPEPQPAPAAPPEPQPAPVVVPEPIASPSVSPPPQPEEAIPNPMPATTPLPETSINPDQSDKKPKTNKKNGKKNNE